MKPLRLLFAVAILALPMAASAAKADNVTASQLSAAGHGRRPILTNRPSREIYHQNRMRRPAGFRHHRGARY